MATRLSNIFWIIVLFVVALLAGGYVAGHLISLEENVLRSLQQELTEAGNSKANETASYLESQQQILQEINKNDVILGFLQQFSGTGIPPGAEVTRALEDTAKLKFSLNHTYVFNTDGQLILRQPEAMNLPLNVRETLDLAYRTGLKTYMFFTSFNSKDWFVASRRIESASQQLGYSAFMLEASAAMDPLRNSALKWSHLDFNLARRSGDDDVFIINWKNERPQSVKYAIKDTNIPLFSGTANIFRSVTLNNNEQMLMYISSVPTFPFWQFISSIPYKEAMAQVQKTRLFYLFGLGVFLLFIFAFMIGFLRRIIDPSLPLIPENLAGLKTKSLSRPTPPSAPKPKKYKAQQNEPVLGINTSFFQRSFFTKKMRALTSPVNLTKSLLGAFPWQGRQLSDEEKARMQQKNQQVHMQEKATPTNTAHIQNTPAPSPNTEGGQKQKGAETQPSSTEPTPEEIAEKKQKEAEKLQEQNEQQKVKQIHRCLQNERYRLFFQPILATDTKDKVMFETLLRLVNDKGDLMQPGEFFPLAIKHGFVDQVDDMVIVASLRRHMEILTQGKSHMLSINLSYGAFSSMNFMNTYQEGLANGKLKPQLLNFELSSREIIEDESAMQFVREMQKSGAKFSVDFFGDPEKTIKAAKKLKFDYMKVDCLKFEGLADGDAKQVERFKVLADASKEHKLPLIAEKIETKSVLWLCEKLNIPYVQGFYIEEPSSKMKLGW